MAYSQKDLQAFQELFARWRDAYKASDEALLSLLRDELAGKPIDPARREEAIRLAAQARSLLVQALRIAPQTRRT